MNNKSLGPSKIKELSVKIDIIELNKLKMIIDGLKKIETENYLLGFDTEQLFEEMEQNSDEEEEENESEVEMEIKNRLIALFNAYEQGLIKIEPSHELKKIQKFSSDGKKKDEKECFSSDVISDSVSDSDNRLLDLNKELEKKLKEKDDIIPRKDQRIYELVKKITKVKFKYK